MSNLATLNWRKLARGSVATVTNSIAEILHGVYLTIQSSSLLYDSSARSNPIVASEYTVAGPLTEAVYWTYATAALTHKSILAGRNANHAATMASPDTNATTANILLAQITKNAGAFDSAADGWLATPFTSGSDYGYGKVGTASATSQTWQWDFYESQEAAALVIQRVSVDALFANLTGAWLDPHTTSTSDGESDGRLYGQCVSAGLGITVSITQASKWNGSNQEFLDHSTTANTEPHAGTFNPGLGTITTAHSRLGIYDTSSVSTFTSRGGQIMTHFDVPIEAGAAGSWIGTLRQIGPGKSAAAGAVLQAGGVDIAYAAFTNSWTTSNACYYLKY